MGGEKYTYSIAMTNAQPMISSSCSHCNAAVTFEVSAVQIRRQNWSYEIYPLISPLDWKAERDRDERLTKLIHSS